MRRRKTQQTSARTRNPLNDDSIRTRADVDRFLADLQADVDDGFVSLQAAISWSMAAQGMNKAFMVIEQQNQKQSKNNAAHVG